MFGCCGHHQQPIHSHQTHGETTHLQYGSSPPRKGHCTSIRKCQPAYLFGPYGTYTHTHTHTPQTANKLACATETTHHMEHHIHTDPSKPHHLVPHHLVPHKQPTDWLLQRDRPQCGTLHSNPPTSHVHCLGPIIGEPASPPIQMWRSPSKGNGCYIARAPRLPHDKEHFVALYLHDMSEKRPQNG